MSRPASLPLVEANREVTLDSETREWLHSSLDRLIEQAEQAEQKYTDPDATASVATYPAVNALLAVRPPQANVPPWVADAIIVEGMKLLSSAVGPAVLRGYFDRPASTGPELRRLLRFWIWALNPLLDRGIYSGGSESLSIWKVMDGLSALDAGEIQPLFRAETGRNRRANRWTLARCKLEALVWKKRLIALGMTEKRANHKITVAFGEQWDTIRKWRDQCSRILGAAHVASMLTFAAGPTDPFLNGRRGMFGASAPLDHEKGLAADGERYREELNKVSSLKPAKADE